MLNKRSSLLGIAAAAALGAFANMPAQPSAETQGTEATAMKANAQKGERNTPNQAPQDTKANALGWRLTRYTRRRFPDGPGWSNRHVQRMARKRQNKARNKAHCKRRGH